MIDFITTLIYAAIFCVVVVGIGALIFYIINKNEPVHLEDMLQKLSEADANRLQLTDISFLPGKTNEWIQEGRIGFMNDKGNKYAIKVLWFDKVIQNHEYNTITYADMSLSKDEVAKHNLKEGDFVKIQIAPEKTFGSFKIIFVD